MKGYDDTFLTYDCLGFRYRNETHLITPTSLVYSSRLVKNLGVANIHSGSSWGHRKYLGPFRVREAKRVGNRSSVDPSALHITISFTYTAAQIRSLMQMGRTVPQGMTVWPPTQPLALPPDSIKEAGASLSRVSIESL